MKHKLSNILHRIHIQKPIIVSEIALVYSEVGGMNKLVVDSETF